VYIQYCVGLDIRKAIANYEPAWGVIEEAATAFGDPNGLDGDDLSHS
jgi:hypothetical protein